MPDENELVDLTDDVLFGDVWERPQLSKRDRSLVTCAALVATGKTEQMDFHIPNALRNGVTQEEIVEMITHLAFRRLAERDVGDQPCEGAPREETRRGELHRMTQLAIQENVEVVDWMEHCAVVVNGAADRSRPRERSPALVLP